MSEAYKRDEKVEICVEVGDRPADTDGSCADGGAYGSGGRGGGSGKKKYRRKPMKMPPGGVGWLKAHFADMKNADIAKHLGVAASTINKWAKRYRLKKSKEFMSRVYSENLELANAFNRATGYRAQSVSAKRLCERDKALGIHRGFKKGHSMREQIGEEREAERIANSIKTRREGIRRDKRRVSLGLEPIGGLVKPTRMGKKEVCLRHLMKHKDGYVVRRLDPIIRYDDKTRRNAVREAHARALGIAVIHVNAKLTDEAIR